MKPLHAGFPRRYLRQVSVLLVRSGHAVQPGPSQLRGAGVGARQAVLEIQEHLRVFLVLSHLGRGHQHCPYPHCQTLYFRGECCGLQDIDEKK